MIKFYIFFQFKNEFNFNISFFKTMSSSTENFETREKFLSAIKNGEDISEYLKKFSIKQHNVFFNAAAKKSDEDLEKDPTSIDAANVDIISDGFNVALLNEKYELAKYFISLTNEVLENTETGLETKSLLRDIDYHKIMIVCGIRKKYDQIKFLFSELGDSPLLRMGLEGLFHLSVKENDRELFEIVTSFGIPLSLTPEEIEELMIRLQKFRNSGKEKNAAAIEGGLKLIGIEA